MRRTNYFSYPSDTFGATAPGSHGGAYSKLTSSIQHLSKHGGTQETMFKGGIDLADVEYVVTQDPVALAKALQARGMNQWPDGRKFEEVLVKPGTKLTARGEPKAKTQGIGPPPKPFKVESNPQAPDQPVVLKIAIPDGYAPVKNPSWNGQWTMSGESAAGDNLVWAWSPSLNWEGKTVQTSDGKTVQTQSGGSSAYAAYTYTSGKAEKPLTPEADPFGKWYPIAQKQAGYKWGWFAVGQPVQASGIEQGGATAEAATPPELFLPGSVSAPKAPTPSTPSTPKVSTAAPPVAPSVSTPTGYGQNMVNLGAMGYLMNELGLTKAQATNELHLARHGEGKYLSYTLPPGKKSNGTYSLL